jgi:CheY-like chemotaxis protein
VATSIQSIKIIYIEDNAANFQLVERVLRATGRFHVLGAADGESGLEMIERERPRLVLVDLDIPTVNGFEVTRQIKGSPDPEVARIPVVAISANVLKNERDSALAAGATAFIEKPFDIREFREQIERLICGAEQPAPVA